MLSFQFEICRLNPTIVRGQIVLHLSLIVLIEEEQGGKLMGSDKIILHLAPPRQGMNLG